MNKSSKGLTALLLAAMVCLGLGACGTGEGGVGVDNTNPSLPSTITVKTGTILTDNNGYTGSSPVQVEAPSKTAIAVQGRTLLVDASNYVVSGKTSTKISFSSDLTTLAAPAQASAPANFVSYIDISMEAVKRAIPALSVTVDVGAVAPGATVTIYNLDAGTGKWLSPQTAVVSGSGQVTFPVSQLSLWGIFR